MRTTEDVRKPTYTIYPPSNKSNKACVGKGTRIGAFCELGDGVVVGENCSIQAFVYIPPNVIIKDNVFIGPRVTFTNDKYPPSSKWKDNPPTIVNSKASIGAGSIILPNIIIGSGAMIGAGSLVTKNVPSNELWYGSPAKFIRGVK